MPAKRVSRQPVVGLSVRDTLFLLSLDLRTSWQEPDRPERVAAWRAWWAMERSEREILPIIAAIARSRPANVDDPGI